MKYKVIDKDTYYRKGVFRHFSEDCKCSTSMTARIDVTSLKTYSEKTNTKFYINFLYILAKVLNSREDYRMGYLWESDELICYDKINPTQYIFHEDTETCTPVYTEYYEDYERFYQAAEKDVEEAKKTREYGLDMQNHPNWFDASYISWLSYDSLNVELPDGYLFFAPIVNWGKYRQEAGRWMMSVSVRLNHAIADGYLVAKVFRLLEQECDALKVEQYRKYFTSDNLMGPNSARLVLELLEHYKKEGNGAKTILDLGCGKGLTSYILHKETGAKVFANDLWVTKEENRERFTTWGVEDFLIPVHEDANDLHLNKNFFDALFSVDSYHYFAGEPEFFRIKIKPFMKKESCVLIAIPGIKDEYEGRQEELLGAWLKDEAYMFKSPKRWKEIIGSGEGIEEVQTWEMKCFDAAWMDWFATENEYAMNDFKYFDHIIKPYTNFVGIWVHLY